MKTLTRLFLCAALLATAFAARAERTFNQAELDALLAPVALYPDAVLNNILDAASYPQDVQAAAAWSRANPQLRGDEALRLVENTPWPPSVKALVATPEILARMDESPQWLADLGEANRVHGPYLMDTVQALRQRAQANGYPPSYYAPEPSGAVYVRYYDPFVVYGPWWWPAYYRPIVWRPFVTHLVVVSHPVFVHRPAVIVRGPVVVHRPVPVHRPVAVQRPVYVQRPPVVRGPVVVQRPPVTPTQFRQDRPRSEPRRFNGSPSPSERVQQNFARQQAQQRPPQLGFQRNDATRARNLNTGPERGRQMGQQRQHRG